MLFKEVKRREERGRDGKNAFEANVQARMPVGRMSSTFFITRVAIDCSAINHEVIDRNEISIVNVHSC